MWSVRLHPTPLLSSAVTSTLVLTQVIQRVEASWSRYTLHLDDPFRWMLMFVLLLSPGVFQLVTETKIPQQHADWSSSGSEESCNMELLSAFPPLMSACNRPSYTNYVGGFHGCLDYIFIQPESMQVWTPAVFFKYWLNFLLILISSILKWVPFLRLLDYLKIAVAF